jgi:hypothetical protein
MENDVKMYGQQEFSLPHDVVKLPSDGKFYKNKQKSVKVGYLTAADENIIMAAKPDEMIMTLLRSKVYEPDLRPDDMLNGDIEAILIFLRNTSFGSEYKIQVTDPATGKKFASEIHLDELDIQKSEVEPEEDGCFSVRLPKSGVQVKIRPLTYKEVVDINKQVESYPAGRVAPKVTWKLQKQIVSVEGDGSLQTISKFIEGLPIMDSKFIKNFLDRNEPRLDLRRSVIAPSGEKVTVDVTFGAEFFRVFF